MQGSDRDFADTKGKSVGKRSSRTERTEAPKRKNSGGDRRERS